MITFSDKGIGSVCSILAPRLSFVGHNNTQACARIHFKRQSYVRADDLSVNVLLERVATEFHEAVTPGDQPFIMQTFLTDDTTKIQVRVY